MAKKKLSEKIAKLKSGKKYFNYGKKGYYIKDCCTLTMLYKRKPEKSIEKAKRVKQKKN